MKSKLYKLGAKLSVAVVVAACMSLAGCSYNKKSDAFMKSYERGEFTVAAVEASKVAKKSSKCDQVICRLEEGTVLRAAGLIQASNHAFDMADEMIDLYDQEANIKISREAFAAVTNLTTMDYKGSGYDRIMMNTYKALNFMELGDLDQARVELRRAYERQKEAVERYAKKIEADEKVRQEKVENAEAAYDLNKANEDEKLQNDLKSQYAELVDMSAYEDYVNPFSEYVQGIFFLTTGGDNDDRERARTSLRRVGGMIQNNEYVSQDIALAEIVANGGPIPPTTYVLFESGMAPQRKSIRIDIPIFLVNIAYKDTNVDYVGASFPRLQKCEGGLEYLLIRTAGQTYRTATLTDMDAVVMQEFKNELPMVITRTLIAAGTKAALAYAANRATEGNRWTNIVTRVSTTIYQAGLNQADLRTWRTLPKQFHVARFPTPEDRQLAIALPNGQALDPIQIDDGVVNVVYVKSVNAAHVPSIRQFKLK